MKIIAKTILALGLPGVVMAAASATVLTVDPLGIGTNIFKTINQAVNFANLDKNLLNTYDIKIKPGIYTNDYANVARPMSLQSTTGTGVTMKSTIPLPNQKGIIATTASLYVKGITFTGAFISNLLGGNGAGIRDQITGAGTLQVENSSFVGNQEGILTGGSKGLENIIVNNTKFMNNGNASKNTGQEHGLYVNEALSVSINGSTFCGQVGQGHNIKVRSAATTITNTQSYEGVAGGGCTTAGNASRGVDIPGGGVLVMSNDDLFQGAGSPNTAMMEFGAEGIKYLVNKATLTGVDFVSTSGGTGIQWYGGTNPCLLTNVSFTGLTRNQNPVGCTVEVVTGGTSSGAGFGLTLAANDAVVADPVAVPEPNSMTMLLSFLALGLGGYYTRLKIR